MKKGICFAGGGIKGVAHIGAIKAFEEENIEFEYVSGTSSGSIVATLYAAGFKADEMYTIFKKCMNKIHYIDLKNMVRFVENIFCKRKFIIDGLNSGEKIEKMVDEVCIKKKISSIGEIKKPLLIPSVDLCNGKIYIFSSIANRKIYSDKICYINDMNIGKAVRASCSYPGVFSPMPYKGTYLIDGGIRENVPWRELKECGADQVISIVFENELVEKSEIQIIDVIMKSIDILCHELSNYELEGNDCLIKIRTENVHLLQKSKMELLYKQGYETTKKFIKNNRIKEK